MKPTGADTSGERCTDKWECKKDIHEVVRGNAGVALGDVDCVDNWPLEYVDSAARDYYYKSIIQGNLIEIFT